MGQEYHGQKVEKDLLRLATDQKKMEKDYHAQGAGEKFSSANNRPEECIWGRITAIRELEKDFFQLTTDQNKAQGEGLSRPGSWQKFSSILSHCTPKTAGTWLGETQAWTTLSMRSSITQRKRAAARSSQGAVSSLVSLLRVCHIRLR